MRPLQPREARASRADRSASWLSLENRDVEARVRADRAPLDPFIEGALRLESPFRGHLRLVRRDTGVAGARCRKAAA